VGMVHESIWAVGKPEDNDYAERMIVDG
jgi:hypothetical protein